MNPSIPPFKIPLGPIEVTGYGLMMMVGFLMAGWLIDRDLRRRGLNADYAADMTVAAVIGGIIGAKLWWVALTGEWSALFSRSGLVWYGGFIGGTLAVIINGWRLKVPTRWTAQFVAPALAAAYPLGRIGCFMVGDDYGIPTTVPWGVKFPQGMPPTTASGLAQFGVTVPEGIDPTAVLAVHPTQLYEIALMTLAFMVLWKLRTRVGGAGWLFGLYLIFAGTERFLIEFLRAKDDRLLGTFTVAQATSVGLILAGAFIVQQLRTRPDPDLGPHLSRPTRASA
jgi:phosphatidylglycerol:prolipoprotein diacylglycerol transferase